MVEFGQRLRTLRRERNLTQKQLAELIGVQHTIISFWELGDRIPSPSMLVKLACTLHVSTDYLLGIEKGESVDISRLQESDKTIVRALVNSLNEKGELASKIAKKK